MCCISSHPFLCSKISYVRLSQLVHNLDMQKCNCFENCQLECFCNGNTNSTTIACASGVSQELTISEANVNLTKKHATAAGPEAPCIFGIDHLSRGYFKDPKGVGALLV